MGEDEAPPPAPAPVIIAPPPTQQANAMDSAMGSAEAMKYILDNGILSQYAQQQTDIQKSQAPQLSQINIDQQKQYGPQLTQLAIDNLKTADPTGFSIRQKLGDLTLNDLSIGGELTPEETRARQQDIRAGQVARGGGTGFGDSLDEARYLGESRFNRDMQRRSNAASFLNGATPQASFASLNQAGQTAPVGTQNTSGAAASLFPSTNALISNQAQNYGTFANFTGNTNNLNSANHWNAFDRISNPFKEDLMFGIGAANGVAKLAGSVAGGAAMMCWVAEELYGVESPTTHRVRAFCMKHLNDETALGSFCRWYQDQGRQVAALIQINKEARRKAKIIWDNLNELALKEGK